MPISFSTPLFIRPWQLLICSVVLLSQAILWIGCCNLILWEWFFFLSVWGQILMSELAAWKANALTPVLALWFLGKFLIQCDFLKIHKILSLLLRPDAKIIHGSIVNLIILSVLNFPYFPSYFLLKPFILFSFILFSLLKGTYNCSLRWFYKFP